MMRALVMTGSAGSMWIEREGAGTGVTLSPADTSCTEIVIVPATVPA
jgi:hypothetical protein